MIVYSVLKKENASRKEVRKLCEANQVPVIEGRLTYIVQHDERACFSNVWTNNEKIFFEYQVVRGGNKDLDVQIITPNGMVLYNRKRASGDEVTFTPQNGEFKFCFSNEFSRISDKVVMFNIRPAYTDTLSREAGDQEPTVKDAGQAACDEIHEAVTAVLNFQRKYRVHEAIGRHLAEQLNRMVSWWSLGQSVVVLLCGVGQVVALKTLFTDTRKSTKPSEGEPEEKQVISYT
nr:hypothetical protein BaRGS_026322 [Batillaria attramentaria]